MKAADGCLSTATTKENPTAAEPQPWNSFAVCPCVCPVSEQHAATMLRQDFLVRAIQQLGSALARIAGLRREDKQAEALAEIAQAKAALPVVPGLVDQLSVRDLIKTLEDEELCRQLAQLYRHEAELYLQFGDQPRAVHCLTRSKELLEEVKQ